MGHSLGGLTFWGVMAASRPSGRLRTADRARAGTTVRLRGVHGKSGLPNNPDFAGSDGGPVHLRFVKLLAKNYRSVFLSARVHESALQETTSRLVGEVCGNPLSLILFPIG